MAYNVLQLLESFRAGGSERQSVQLTRLLHESGRFRVHVACLNADGVLRDEVDRLGVGPIPAYPLTSFYDRNAWTQLRRFARHLRESEIDVVHTHDYYTNVFGMLGAALARVPVRVASRRETTGIRTPAQKAVERFAYRFAHAIVANAEAVRRDLVAEGVRDAKISTVYNGIGVERVANDAAPFALPWDGERRVVTIVANLRLPVKDHPTFLRAARRVRDEVPDAAFVVAGEGELLDETRALARELGLERDVHFTGRCDDVGALLAASDAGVLCSKAEGFSNAILEYMAAGLPVVATDVGGAREAIVEGETGYLVAVGDDAGLAARLVDLLRAPERSRAMGELGRARVLGTFSCEAQRSRVEALYDGLLARATSGAREPGDRAVAR